MSEPTFGVVCGNCGGPLFMATCHHFRGSGHEWVLVSICMLCRHTHWTETGCVDCSSSCPEGRASSEETTNG